MTATPFAYFDCFAGVSGDMALGALLDAGASAEALRAGLAGVPLDPFELEVATVERGGIGNRAASERGLRIGAHQDPLDRHLQLLAGQRARHLRARRGGRGFRRPPLLP